MYQWLESSPYANQREATAQAYYVMIEKFNMKQFSDWQISLILDEWETR